MSPMASRSEMAGVAARPWFLLPEDMGLLPAPHPQETP